MLRSVRRKVGMMTTDDAGRAFDFLQIATEDSGAENVLDEFVDLFNARDLDALASLVSEDLDAEFLKVAGREGAMQALENLFIRQPFTVATRGELGLEPIAALWQPTGEDGSGYVVVGYLVFECSDEDEPLITRVEYFEELEDVLLEEPDGVIEGLDWDLADLDRS